MTPTCSNFTQTHRLSTAVMLVALTSGCAGSSRPDSEDNQPSAAAQLNDPRRFSVLMEWDIPLARVNGDPLYVNDLTGYEIQYSMEQEGEIHSIRINDPLQTELRLQTLPPGDYQFTIAAIATGGQYGEFSPGVSLTLQ